MPDTERECRFCSTSILEEAIVMSDHGFVVPGWNRHVGTVGGVYVIIPRAHVEDLATLANLLIDWNDEVAKLIRALQVEIGVEIDFVYFNRSRRLQTVPGHAHAKAVCIKMFDEHLQEVEGLGSIADILGPEDAYRSAATPPAEQPNSGSDWSS